MMKILYLSRSKLDHSVNAVYIKGLKQNGVDVDAFKVSNGFAGLLTAIGYLKGSKKADLIMVGYDSPALVIAAKIFGRKKVVYNALCSVYERLVVSRGLTRPFSSKAIYYWFMDFIAVHLADLTMLETEEQKKYFRKLFKVSERKLFRAWTGVDQEIFFYDPAVEKLPIFTVIFRGQFLPESGVEYAIEAAKILENEDINFIIHGGGQNIDKVKKLTEKLRPKNLKLVTEFLSEEELRTLMQKCHLNLGQLSDHPRLDRTIPHKCYESLAMKLPYLTAANKGVLELIKDGETCIICEPANAKLLAEKILWAEDHPKELKHIAENDHRLFQEKLTSKLLADSLLTKLAIQR